MKLMRVETIDRILFSGNFSSSSEEHERGRTYGISSQGTVKIRGGCAETQGAKQKAVFFKDFLEKRDS